MAHISHDDLNRKLSAAVKLVSIGSVYKHYKYPLRDYKVTILAVQEATEKICVIYKDISEPDAPPFVRDLDSWLEKVEWEGKAVPRFVLTSNS
jgi:hypothetical protein